MTNSESIRKAAILVSLLDSRSADALLDPMEEELAAQVRQAVMELDEVSPEEQEEVLADFFGRGAQDDLADGAVDLELSSDPSGSQPAARREPLAMPPRGSPVPSLTFLADVPPTVLADHLARELPQTVAVVVAHLSPQHAGQVLERLPPSLATDALSRMAWLTNPAPEALADLESELRRRLAPFCQSPGAGLASFANVQAILASLPGQRRAQLIDRLARQDERLASRLDAAGPSRAAARQSQDEIISLRYRLESAERQPAADRTPAAASGPLVEFEDLALLSDRDLARFVAATNLQSLSLALIEADERLTRRVLVVLPGEDAAEIRRRLAHPGPIRLKDIDQAQRQLADLARRLAGRGQISLPPSRRFAAAA